MATTQIGATTLAGPTYQLANGETRTRVAMSIDNGPRSGAWLVFDLPTAATMHDTVHLARTSAGDPADHLVVDASQLVSLGVTTIVTVT